MRLRSGLAVAVSVLVLVAIGVVGVAVNRSALRTADRVHRADTMALGTDNGTLAGQMQLLSAQELDDFAEAAGLTLRRDSAADRAKLTAFAGKSAFFGYGLALLSLEGEVLNATRATGLPAPTDPGYATLHAGLRAGNPGFSSVLMVDGVALAAVGVPVHGKAILVGYNNVAGTQLQAFVARLGGGTHLTTIVDAEGRAGATSDPKLIGTTIDPTLIAAAHEMRGAGFVEYATPTGTRMIAVVVPGIPGGWTYVRTQTLASFDGAVRRHGQTLDLALLAMLLAGVIGIAIFAYRALVTRRRADEKFRALFQHAPDMVAVVDAEGKIAYSSPSAATVLGHEPGALAGSSLFDVVHPQDRGPLQEQFAELVGKRDGLLNRQTRMITSDGRPRWFEFTASNQLHNSALAGVVINARDVTETRLFQERLAHQARHDALTGLPNRRRMRDTLDETLPSDGVAVLYVDLNGFKPVNDAYGPNAGDDLLRQVAKRLSGAVREQDVLSRVGGDEFVILMPGVDDEAAAQAMADRVRAETARPFELNGTPVVIGASVGVNVARPGSDPDDALRDADQAMYAVKHGDAPAVAAPRRAGRHRATP
ncbi:diguanylate cyclase domain-containing protein [Actinoplanes sp. NPDC049265]|uniref:diguanylate cyclase domain-containing protein n=1 Tax=Actinoplanes sp. NPDC049265 TaxID=3363902 RepID=UPI0037149B1F